jgi:phosphatidylglycerophosphate synthase
VLDRIAMGAIKPGVDALARVLVSVRATPNQITVAAFVVGVVAAILIAAHAYIAAAVVILFSRLLDALDGAVARVSGKVSDQGGFLDIALDFLFYAGIPLGFAFADPQANALAAATLLAAFIGTGSSFLAFAVMAAKRNMTNTAYPNKSFYFLGGLTEATETLAFFVAMCIWPAHFAVLAYLFAALCGVTIFTRIVWGMRAFS